MALNTKLVFFGGNALSVIVLKKLIENGIKPDLIITTSDEPTGKKKILTAPSLVHEARKFNIQIEQPVSLKKDHNIIEKLQSLRPELGIVAAYPRFFHQTAINTFTKGVLAMHPSLLPRYRGPSPIQAAILNNDTRTGVSIILLDEQMDHGPILVQEKVALTGHEYFPELYEKLANLGGEVLAKIIPLWLNNKVSPVPQDESKVSFCKKIAWQDGKIDFDDPYEKTYARIRAMSQEPGVWVQLSSTNNRLLDKKQKGFIVKIISAKPINDHQSQMDRTGLQELNKNLILVCRDGALLLERIQPEGRHLMTGREFLNGYRKIINQ